MTGVIITTLLLSMVVISLVLAGANYLAYRLFGRPTHALMWAVTFGLVAVQYSVNLAKDLMPSETVYWQSANMISFALVLFAVWGHRDRLGLATRRRNLTAIFVALSLLSALFTAWYPVLGIRTALAPGVAFLAMSHIAVVLLRYSEPPRLAAVVSAVIHLLFGLTQGAAAAIALSLNDQNVEVLKQLYAMVNFGLMPTLFVALGISVIFLLATDLSRRLHAQALRDELTGVNNRRGFMTATESLWAHCDRRSEPLTILLADIDYFKHVNDEYGHSFGDKALQHFARVMADSVRAEDVLGRIGGEEFAVTMGEMTREEAQTVAARIRSELFDRPVINGSNKVWLRASFGIAQREEGDGIDSLLKRSDIALYAAKAGGRDRAIISEAGLVGMASNG